jgi:hypothetical protein
MIKIPFSKSPLAFFWIGVIAAGVLIGAYPYVRTAVNTLSNKSRMASAIPDRPTTALSAGEVLKKNPAVVGCLESEKQQQEKCVNEYLKATSAAKGPRPALDVIEALSQKYPQLLAWAHPFAHTIGDNAVRYYQKLKLPLEAQIGRGIVECDGYGSFGCYHGIIEVTTHDIPIQDRARVLRKACFDDPAIASKPYFIQQCAHWFGHSMVMFTDAPLLEVLKMCQGVDPDWGHGGVQLCLSGTFHAGLAPGEAENDDILKRNIVKVFKPGDPYYPCLDIPERFRGHCYSHAYGRAMSMDIGTQLETCDKIPEADPVKKRVYVGGCYDSVGNNVIEASNFEPARVAQSCQKHTSQEYRQFCYGGAARYWVLRNPILENTKPLEMCSLAEDWAKPTCYARAGFGNYENFASHEILADFCSRAEPAYRETCIKRTAPGDFTGGYVEGSSTLDQGGARAQ